MSGYVNTKVNNVSQILEDKRREKYIGTDRENERWGVEVFDDIEWCDDYGEVRDARMFDYYEGCFIK